MTNQPKCCQYSNNLETGLSSFHLLTVTEFKMGFQRVPPKLVNYQDYKNFDNEKFGADACKFDFNACDLERFKNTIFSFFNKLPFIERKYIRVKESPFMTKELHKAIIKRYKLRNKFFKSKWFSDRQTYISRHNFCKKLLRNTKRTYFDSLNI